LGTASTAIYGFGPASAEVRLYAGLTTSSLAPVLIGPAGNQPFVLNTSSTLSGAQGTFNGGNNLVLPYDGSVPVFLRFIAVTPYGFGNGSPIIQLNLATGAEASTTEFSATPDFSHWGPLILLAPEPSVLALTGSSLALMFFARPPVNEHN
jgi:hypothetical protein